MLMYAYISINGHILDEVLRWNWGLKSNGTKTYVSEVTV
ncbi:hypothetical protein HmCmsJML079_03115 [Escherichia coli]|nr:hypothetical protein HmCmsJML079_03115 [Escherichia coli]